MFHRHVHDYYDGFASRCARPLAVVQLVGGDSNMVILTLVKDTNTYGVHTCLVPGIKDSRQSTMFLVIFRRGKRESGGKENRRRSLRCGRECWMDPTRDKQSKEGMNLV